MIGGYDREGEKAWKSMEKHNTTFFVDLNSEREKDW